jgi:hypothetical protein
MAGWQECALMPSWMLPGVGLFNTLFGGPKMISCRDGCGREVNDEAPEKGSWTYLQITKRWRCPACTKVLHLINKSTPEEETGPLDPSSDDDSSPRLSETSKRIAEEHNKQ